MDDQPRPREAARLRADRPAPDGPCKVIDSAVLEESLDARRLWWELHPDGQYGRPEE